MRVQIHLTEAETREALLGALVELGMVKGVNADLSFQVQEETDFRGERMGAKVVGAILSFSAPATK